MEKEFKLLKKEIYNLPIEQQKTLLTAITEGYELADEVNNETYAEIEEQVFGLPEKYKAKIFNSLTYHLIEQPKESFDSNSMKVIFTLIKECMTSKKLSERQIEKEIGITQSSIYAWRIAKAKPSLDALIKLANYFNVTVDYLLDREASTATNISTPSNQQKTLVNAPEGWDKLDEIQRSKVNGIIQGMLLTDIRRDSQKSN